MIEEQDPSPEYIKAFNNGYTLQKNDPDLLQKVLTGVQGKSEVIKAMIAGRKQAEIERINELKENASERKKERERER